MNITRYLNSFGYNNYEGYCQQIPQQVEDLIQLTKHSKTVMEIGFNAGHSAELFLSNSQCILTSFDIGYHDYVHNAKNYIDLMYPNRHTLILGDSTVTVPKCNNTFDVIFIDGCHEYDVAKQDLENCIKLAHKDTIIIMDDTIYTKGLETSWTIGPTNAWNENANIHKICRKDYMVGRGMSWGNIVMETS
jgi:predicted O-methyltransferase YrrM